MIVSVPCKHYNWLKTLRHGTVVSGLLQGNCVDILIGFLTRIAHNFIPIFDFTSTSFSATVKLNDPMSSTLAVLFSIVRAMHYMNQRVPTEVIPLVIYNLTVFSEGRCVLSPAVRDELFSFPTNTSAGT